MSQNETSYPDYDDLIEDVISAAQDVLSSIDWGENGRNAAARLDAAKEALVIYITGVEARLAKAKARIVELEDAHRWIPLEEERPEMHTTVMVACEDGYVADAVVNPWSTFDSGFPFPDVTHWMPMPKSPKSMDRKEADEEPR